MDDKSTQPKNNLDYSGQDFLKNMLPKEEDEQNFIKKDELEQKLEGEEKKFSPPSEIRNNKEVKKVIHKLRNIIFPKNNQQRSLGLEVGGLEIKKKKPRAQDDIWDDRHEEIAAMANKSSTSKAETALMMHKKRQKKIHDRKEMARDALAAGAAMAKGDGKQAGAQGIGLNTPQVGYVSRLKNLKQDRSHENNNHGGGMWR